MFSKKLKKFTMARRNKLHKRIFDIFFDGLFKGFFNLCFDEFFDGFIDGFIDGSRGDLSVIWGESNREDVFGVTDKGLVGLGGLEVPESDGTIP